MRASTVSISRISVGAVLDRCGVKTRAVGCPSAVAWVSAASMKPSEATKTPGIRRSRSLMSCTLHVVQLPQSASASITASHDVAICGEDRPVRAWRVGQKRATDAPSPVSFSSTRSRKTSPRFGDVEESDGETVERFGPRHEFVPFGGTRWSGRGRWSSRDLLRRADTTFRRRNPTSKAIENRPVAPPACTTWMPPGQNLPIVLPANASGRPSSMPSAPRSGRRCPAGDGSPVRRGTGLDPSGVSVPGHVLGADHKQGLHHRHLRGEIGLERVGEVLCERLRRAGELIDEDLRSAAAPDSDGRLVGVETSAFGERGPRRADLVLGEPRPIL